MTDLILPRQNEKFAGFSENTLQYRSAASLRSYPHRRKGDHQKGISVVRPGKRQIAAATTPSLQTRGVTV